MKLHFLYVHPNMFTLIPYLVGPAQVVQTLIQMTRREIQILSRQLSDPFPPSGTPMPRGATVDYPRGLLGFEPILWQLMLLAHPHPNCLWQNSYKMSKYTFFLSCTICVPILDVHYLPYIYLLTYYIIQNV